MSALRTTAARAAVAMAALLAACSTPPPSAPGAASASMSCTVKPTEAEPPPEPAIRINQVGFLPGAAKWAVVSGGTADRFVLVDADSGAERWSGRLGTPGTWCPAGETVRLADFSALRQPGRYRLRVPGLPDSPPFAIGSGLYEPLAAASLKAFYFNRASIELKPEHAGAWARPAGHPDTQVLVHASAAGPGRPAGTVISAPRGWYDAGDYNKYIVNSGISTYTLLAAWEHFPAFFRRQRLGIPESGKGLPDVLAEALWNLEWMLAMQDPADGGVYSKLTNLRFDGMVMPHEATAPRYVVQKTTAAALDFAAVMAAASRVFAPFEAQRPGLAAQARAAALAAWAWAQANPAVVYRQPADVQTGAYGDDQFADEFAWAAAELYVTTREDRFWAALKADAAPAEVPGWGNVGGLAWVTLAQHRERLTAAADRGLIERRIQAVAARQAAVWTASPWGSSLQTDDFVWGSNGVLLNQALMLVQGFRLGGERRQLDAAQAALDYVLGRNATGYSMVTGFGGRPPMHPHHRPSEADGIAAPVPGFIVGGPNTGLQDARNCPVAYPSKWAARTYLDHVCSYASNEVAINWNAPLVYLAAALEQLTDSAR